MTTLALKAQEEAGGLDAPLLDVDDLVVEIDTPGGVVHALNGVSLHVRKGETLGLVGESGSGKTMTAMSIPSLLPPRARVVSGRIHLGGVELTGASTSAIRQVRSDGVGVVFQNPTTALNPRLTIGAQLREALPPTERRPADMARRRCADLLNVTGIPRAEERLFAYPHELSGGMCQRVVIAMALARQPRLLIADEPTTALDVSIQAQILDLLSSLQLELGLAVLIVSHDMRVIADRADRVAVMYAGRVVETGEVSTVLTQPRHRYTEALLRALPVFVDGKQTRLRPIEGLPPDLRQLPEGCAFAPRCAAATDHCRIGDPPEVGVPNGHWYRCFNPTGALDADASPAEAATADASPAEAARAKITPTRRLPMGHANGIEGEPLLRLDSVVKRFTRHGAGWRSPDRFLTAVAGANVTVSIGDTLGVVGESGSGKTTLARLMVGLEQATEGKVTYLGRPIGSLDRAGQKAWRRDVQLIFQDAYSSLDPRMTVEQILEEPLRLHLGRGPHRDRVVSLMAEVGLASELASRRPTALSGGQRQRVGIARALALDPHLVIADEPVSALDVSVQAMVLNLLRRLQRQRGLATVVISHDLSVVANLCEKVVIMYLGTIVESGNTVDVFARPRHPYTHGLLESMPGQGRQMQPALIGEATLGQGSRGCPFADRCPRVKDRCRDVVPTLVPDGPDRHVACHFPISHD